MSAEILTRLDEIEAKIAKLTAIPPRPGTPRDRVRCPSVDHETQAQCVRDEGHDYGHVGANGEEWMVALRCRIGMTERGPAICDRIDGHVGACVPRPGSEAREAAPAPTPREKKTRGVCGCGKSRKEHQSQQFGVGGCAETGCKKYKP